MVYFTTFGKKANNHSKIFWSTSNKNFSNEERIWILEICKINSKGTVEYHFVSHLKNDQESLENILDINDIW